MDGREQVLNILVVLGQVFDGLENADYPGLSGVSEGLKEALTRLDELKNKLFMRSKKSLNFTRPLWDAAVNLGNSLNSTGETTGGKGGGERDLPRLLEDFKNKLEALEKAVKSHSVLIT